MKTTAQKIHSIAPILIGAALFLTLAALPETAPAQTREPIADNSKVASDHRAQHSGMHSVTPFDVSEASEVGESASVVSAESPATVSVSNFAFTPGTVTVPQGQTVRWNFEDNTTHTVTENSAMALFDSGNKSLGDSFPFVFSSAGIYPYHCQIHSSMQGAVQVPIQVAPANGGAATAFKITWSSTPAGAGFVFDIQVKRPGARSFVDWKTGLTKRMSAFKPGAGPGNYSFRARLRKVSTDAHSLYSPFRTITVK